MDEIDDRMLTVLENLHHQLDRCGCVCRGKVMECRRCQCIVGALHALERVPEWSILSQQIEAALEETRS